MNIKSMNKKVIIPYVRISQIIALIKAINKRATTVADLKLFGLSRSQAMNAIPTAQVLQLISYNKNIINLTDKGKSFKLAIVNKNDKKASEIIKEAIVSVEAIQFIVNLLNKKEILNIKEIGYSLAAQFNKSWNNPLTYQAHGAACASIIAFAGSGKYYGGALRTRNLQLRPASLPAPDVTFKKITQLLKALHTNQELDINGIAKKTSSSSKRLSSELPVLIELNLIKKNTAGLFNISPLGSQLIDPSLVNDQSIIFKKAIKSSGYSQIIEKLKNSNLEVKEIGNIICYSLKRDWKDNVKSLYGTKFKSWLVCADLIKKIGPGKWQVQEYKKNEKLESKNNPFAMFGNPKKIISRNENVFNLGKLAGFIQGQLHSNKIDDVIKEAIDSCKEFDLTLIETLLTEHYQLFKETGDYRIFTADLKLLEKDLIKIGGSNGN